jgi:hypothetical protein
MGMFESREFIDAKNGEVCAEYEPGMTAMQIA